MIVVVVIVATIAIVGSVYYLATVNRSSILPQVHSENIVHGLITVQAGSYNDYWFTVPVGATNAYLTGTFAALRWFR